MRGDWSKAKSGPKEYVYPKGKVSIPAISNIKKAPRDR
jgi:hypothetical protein